MTRKAEPQHRPSPRNIHKTFPKAAIGARVMFCGHEGWFIADIITVGNVCVVRANGRVNGSTIIRTDLDTATHHISDFPSAGFWGADIGVFVVPEAQLTVLRGKR